MHYDLVAQETRMPLNKASSLSRSLYCSVLTRKLSQHRTLGAAPRAATTDMTRVVSVVNTDQVGIDIIYTHVTCVYLI